MSEYDDSERDNSDLQDYEIEVNEPPVDQFVPKVPLVERLMAFLYKRDQKRLTDGINTGAKDKVPKSMGNMSAGMTLRSIRASIIEGINKINRAIAGSDKQGPKETLEPTTMAKFDAERAAEKMREGTTEPQVEIAPEQANRIFPKGVDVAKSSVVPNPSSTLTSKIAEAVDKYNKVAEKAEKQAPTQKVTAEGTTVNQKTVVDANGNKYGRVVPGPLGGIKAKEETVVETTVETEAPPKPEAKPTLSAEKISVNKDAPNQDKTFKIIKPDEVGKESKPQEKKTTIVNPILGNIENTRDD
jgi:hypothetical protein